MRSGGRNRLPLNALGGERVGNLIEADRGLSQHLSKLDVGAVEVGSVVAPQLGGFSLMSREPTESPEEALSGEIADKL